MLYSEILRGSTFPSTTYKTGKLPKKNDYRTLHFGNYASSLMPAPSIAFDVLPIVGARLNNTNYPGLFPMDGNDKVGDCTIAGLAHAITVFRGLLNVQKVMTTADVELIYFGLSGGKDTGLNMLDVLNWWRTNAVGGTEQILGYVSIDPKNHDHIKQAMATFGGVYLGLQVTQDLQRQFANHQAWTPGPLTNDGHAVLATGYDQTLVKMLTWGSVQNGTWDWWDECVDEAYAILPPEAADLRFSGFDMKTLLADLAAIGSTPPVVTPPPTPAPPPPVPPTPTPVPSNFHVGPGVIQAMSSRGDVPASDEIYFGGASLGPSEFSMTMGLSGTLYVWTRSTNRVVVKI